MYKPKQKNIIKLKAYLDTQDEKPNKPKRRRTRTKQLNAVYFSYRNRANITDTSVSVRYCLYPRQIHNIQKK